MKADPKIDVRKAAEEIKNFIKEKKDELVDWSYWNIEAYPDPLDRGMPELKKFARMWEEFFDYADKVTGVNGEEFPQEIVERYEAETKKIEAAVNEDNNFWEELRGEIMPLYRPLTEHAELTELDQFKEYWPAIQKAVFDDNIQSTSVGDDMRILLQNFDTLGIMAKGVFEQMTAIDMTEADFRTLVKSYADKLMMDKWNERWKAISLFYDPLAMDVKTTKIIVNKKTGKKSRGEVLRERTVPAGFVVRIL